jgi:TetR/AcrR family transcriptional regulator, cholesterol catabolism regulator
MMEPTTLGGTDEADMPLGRRERKKLEVLQRLRQAAAELFAEKGYDATTVEEIAARADVAKGTFFNYFPRKDALLTALAEDVFARIGEELGPPAAWPGTAREQIRRLFLKFAEAVECDPELSKVMLIENTRNFWLRTSEDPLEEAFRELTRGVLEAGVARGEFVLPVRVETAVKMLEATYFTTMVDWLREGARGSDFRGELTRRLDIVFRGLGAADLVAKGGTE